MMCREESCSRPAQRVEDKVAFAKEILRLYEPDSLSERENNAKI